MTTAKRAFITGITNATTFTISNNATAAGAVTGTFSAPAFFNVATGKLKPRESVAQGIESAPEAFLGLLKGKNFGKQLVKLI